MKIAFLGYGNVGAPLADRLAQLGHDVELAAAEPLSDTAKAALARNPRLRTAPPAQALAAADAVFLATPYAANAAALEPHREILAGKILVDCTNPVGPGLTHGLQSARSGTEVVQDLVPEARVVKAFTIYGFENFADNAFPGTPLLPVMMFCGNDAEAKRTVSELIAGLGWEPLDVGGLEQALHLEHLTLLWIKMVRMHGAPVHTVWARLSR